MVKFAAAMRLRDGETWADVARRAAGLGFRGVSIGFDHRWAEPDLVAIRQAFDEQGVEIAELGTYLNFLTPRDDEARRNSDRLRLAFEAGAILNCDHAVTYAGSRHPDPDQPFAPHPDNWSDATWDTLVQRIWALLDEVQDLGVRLCFEPHPSTTLNSLDSLADLVADAATFRVCIALDPSAIFTPAAAKDTRRALAEAFGVLADKVAIARATDVALTEAAAVPTIGPAPLGQGVLDYEVYLKLVNALELDTPVIVKYQGSDDAYRAAREFLARMARRAGIDMA